METNVGLERKNQLSDIFKKTVERHAFCMEQSSDKTAFTE
jgi:hypothetical protein